MKEEKLPYVTNIQKYSIHDGKGIRTTVFFKGCPLSCTWCHNPETQRYDNCALFYEERCTGCAACVTMCPQHAVQLKEGHAVTDPEICTACGTCLDECFQNAREISGKTYKLSDLVQEVLKDMVFYETSGGGVTLSGGEVLARDLDYIEKLMKSLFSRGISINIDTCGEVPFEAFERILPYTDTFLYDLKLYDETLHKKYTGRSNQRILENLIRLSESGANIWVRIPVIGGVNDTMENIRQTGEFLKEHHIRMEQINLLPYHDTGSSKYSRISREYEGKDFYVPSEEQMEDFRAELEKITNTMVYIGG